MLLLSILCFYHRIHSVEYAINRGPKSYTPMSNLSLKLTVSKQKGAHSFLATIFTGLEEIINSSVSQNFTSFSKLEPVIVSTNLLTA